MDPSKPNMFNRTVSTSNHSRPPVSNITRKFRSTSLTPDNDANIKKSNEEKYDSSTVSTEVPSVAEIIRKLENGNTAKTSDQHLNKKRTSEPFTGSSNNQTNTTKISLTPVSPPILLEQKLPAVTQAIFVKPQTLPKPKSSLLTQPNVKSQTMLGLNIPMPQNNIDNIKANNTSDKSSPSCITSSSAPFYLFENGAERKENPVKEISKMFDQSKTPHFYQSRTVNQNANPVNNANSSELIQTARKPPARPAPRPEKYIKSQISDWSSISTLDTLDNTAEDSGRSSNQNLTNYNSSDTSFTDEEEDYDAENKIKLQKTIEEVYATEKTYVNILYVLSVKLSAEVKNTCDKDDNVILTFNNTYKPLLGIIQQIYQLHYDMILPEFEKFIIAQRTGNMWTVLEKNYKYIEVLYKHYYVTYNEIQGKLDDLCKTYPSINEAMLKCQVYLGNLYPTSQLNCPNQRLLRYILCLKTYMKYLNEHSNDYKHTRSIHDELDRIAGRCEEELFISSMQLNDLRERLDNKFECIKDHRKLLWHGPLKKQSPRRHADIVHRYMILFSDCILVCSEESARKLEIKRELSMRSLTVEIISSSRQSTTAVTDTQNASTTYYPFRLNAVEKSYEFLTEKDTDREKWVKKIRQASEDFDKRNTNIEMRHISINSDEQQLGNRAPAWVNDLDVTRCQNCNNRFPTGIISSRRHHCRSCGRCICGQCSTKKTTLSYCSTEGEVRVCDTCYTYFTGTTLSKNTSVWPKTTREVDQTILFGDFRTVNSGTVVWVALQEDYQLHAYGGRLDQAEDFAIKLTALVDFQVDFDTRVFTLREISKVHIFTIESNHQIKYPKSDIIDRKMKDSENTLTFYARLWEEAIELARQGNFPNWYNRKRDSSDSGVSNIS